MRNAILALCLTAISGVYAFAQADDYKKGEVFVGYSNQQVDTGFDSGESFEDFLNDRETFHGFNVSGVYNVSRYFGIKGDVSGAYNKTEFDFPAAPGSNISFDANSSLYNFVGGVQFKDNSSDSRFKPFAHAMAGAGHSRVRVTNLTCPVGVDCTDIDDFSETGFAAVLGGGLDIKLSNRIDFRAIQLDYNPMRFEGFTQHNVRFGVGLVFR